MATNTVGPETDVAVLEGLVEPEPGAGRDKARLKDHGIPVWALIAALRETAGDVEQVAAAYQIPTVAVHAAIHYYERNQAFIDAFLLLNSDANDF